jgi:hypothetical protein
MLSGQQHIYAEDTGYAELQWPNRCDFHPDCGHSKDSDSVWDRRVLNTDVEESYVTRDFSYISFHIQFSSLHSSLDWFIQSILTDTLKEISAKVVHGWCRQLFGRDNLKNTRFVVSEPCQQIYAYLLAYSLLV